MAKGYLVTHVDVDDPEIHETYKAANAAPFAEYGARLCTVVIEFPSYAATLACYNSDAYQGAKGLRDPASTGDLVIAVGYDG